MTRCFLCNKPIRNKPYTVWCNDEQAPFVGPDCYQKVKEQGPLGLPTWCDGPVVYAKPEWSEFYNRV